MANVVITSTTNSISAVFNDESEHVGFSQKTWRKESVINIDIDIDEEFIFIKVIAEIDLKVSKVAGDQTSIIIDSVNGVAPTSNLDLYDKLKVLIQ